MHFKDGREEGDIPGLNDLLKNPDLPQFTGGFVIDWEGSIYFYNGKNNYKDPVQKVIGLSYDLKDEEYRRKTCPQME